MSKKSINALKSQKIDFPESLTHAEIKLLFNAQFEQPIDNKISDKEDKRNNLENPDASDSKNSRKSDGLVVILEETVANTLGTEITDATTTEKVQTDAPEVATGKNNLLATNLVNDDGEINMLRKQMELLELKKKLKELENDVQIYKQNERRLNFSDVEHAIIKFSGDDRSQDVNIFLKDFEQIMGDIKADESFKLLCLRRSLREGSAAQCVLRTSNATNYENLKQVLIKEFSTTITRQDVYRMLKQNKFKKNTETMHHYVLKMQEIAARGELLETEVIDFIIDGFEEAQLNTTMLMGIQTLEQLKHLIIRYEDRYLNKSTVTNETKQKPFENRFNANTSSRNRIIRPSSGATVTNLSSEDTRCFNCQRMGHFQSNCPYEMRPVGSCFKCWKMGHNHSNCTNLKKVPSLKNNARETAVQPVVQAAIAEWDVEAGAEALEAVNRSN